MALTPAPLNWPGVALSSLALWAIRFPLKRRFDRPDRSRAAAGTVAIPRNSVVTEFRDLTICVTISSGLAWFQSLYAHSLGDAIWLGLGLAVVPAAYLTGVDVGASEKRGSVRGAVVAVAFVACSLIIYTVRL